MDHSSATLFVFDDLSDDPVEHAFFPSPDGFSLPSPLESFSSDFSQLPDCEYSFGMLSDHNSFLHVPPNDFAMAYPTPDLTFSLGSTQSAIPHSFTSLGDPFVFTDPCAAAAAAAATTTPVEGASWQDQSQGYVFAPPIAPTLAVTATATPPLPPPPPTLNTIALDFWSTSASPRSRASSSCSFQPPSLNMVEYRFSDETQKLVPSSIGNDGRRKTRGRKQALSPEQKKNAHIMRIIGACSNCRARKAVCNPEIPCRSCVQRFKGDLAHHPCRGRRIEDLGLILIPENLTYHPSPQTLESFLGLGNYELGTNVFVVPLTIGFGPPLAKKARLVLPRDLGQLMHTHVVYDWPPVAPGCPNVGKPCLEEVLPAVLVDTTDLVESLDKHLSLLVNSHFEAFPHYQSPLSVLHDIYRLYKSLSSTESDILFQSLKLLVLVHVSGDISVASTYTSHPLTGEPFSSSNVLPKPCFIRGQLGAAIPVLAQTLLRSVLSSLERLAVPRQSREYPIIIAVFCVLFMAIESIQYHAAREAYHVTHDDSKSQTTASSSALSRSAVGADAILNFYSVCYSGCHEQITAELDLDRGLDGKHSRTISRSIPVSRTTRGSLFPQAQNQASPQEIFIARLKTSLRNSQEYLVMKSKATLPGKVAAGANLDTSSFFDTLLARLFLLKK